MKIRGMIHDFVLKRIPENTTEWVSKGYTLYFVLSLSLLFGGLTLIPSIGSSIHERKWLTIILMLIPYTVTIIIFVSKKIRYEIRCYILCISIIIVGFSSFNSIGLVGSSRLWFLCSSVLACLLINIRAAVLIGLISFVTLIGFGISKGFTLWLPSEPDHTVWIITSTTFILVNILALGSTYLIVLGLRKSEHKISESEKNYRILSEKLTERLRHEEVLASCSKDLLRGGDEAVRTALDRLAEATGAARVCVFENVKDSTAGLCMRHKYEAVTKDLTPGMAVSVTPFLHYHADGFARWAEMLGKGEHLNGVIEDFVESERNVLRPQGVGSILVLPIEVGGQWWGFIRFDQSNSKRVWSDPEIKLLRVAAELLGSHLERKRAEEALEASEFRFRSFVENANDIVYTLSPAGVFTYISPNWLDFLGEPAEEALGKSFELYVHPADVPLCLKFLQRVLDTGKKQNSVEYRVRHANGSWRWHVSNGSPMRDPGGDVIGFLGIGRDVTEQKHAEEALRENERFLRTVLQTTADGFWVLDSEGVITDVNEASCRFSGYTRDEILGLHISDMDADHSPDQTRERIRRVIADGAELFEARHRRKDGSLYPVEISAAYLESEGGMLVCFSRDLSERVKAEEERERLSAQLHQSQKLESIGTLAGGIAHDFNNILSIIVGNTELAMLDLPEWNSARKNLKQVRTAVLRARELIQQILFFARQKERALSNISLGPVARESLKMLRASIPATVEIRESIQENLPSIFADPSQIQQVIMNLCTNAGQVMEVEGGVLTFVLSGTELSAPLETFGGSIPKGRYLRLLIRDTGPGIDPENLERIFDPFFTTKGVGEGTGLGLAVVHGIVQDHKGGITVESEQGIGTTFSIYLPASDVEQRAPEVEHKAEPLPGTERILFVDDEPMILKMAKTTLERQGYLVETRASGTDALECFKIDPTRFDIVITDMTMPGMRGDILARAILENRPGIPIILCTGYNRQISKDKAAEIGIRDLVMKPLTAYELTDTVRRVLDGRSFSRWPESRAATNWKTNSRG